jgi:hypothetical protein
MMASEDFSLNVSGWIFGAKKIFSLKLMVFFLQRGLSWSLVYIDVFSLFAIEPLKLKNYHPVSYLLLLVK